ncbi:MAG: DUF211 domain-containing protein [Candidatus Altiarchaeota archaeon]
MDKQKKPLVLLVLDVLKPHKPNIVELGRDLCEWGVEASSISVYAVDEKTESIKIVIEGKGIDFEKIRTRIEDSGAVVHSIDRVVYGRKIPEK